MTKTKCESQKLPPIHPGEILREDYLKPLGVSMNRLALALRVPVTGIAEIVHERRSITAETAIRLGRILQDNFPVLAQPSDRLRFGSGRRPNPGQGQE